MPSSTTNKKAFTNPARDPKSLVKPGEEESEAIVSDVAILQKTAKEEMKAVKESESFDLPDVASLKGSELGESLFSAPRTQVSWSYGKYMEGLDRQRMVLLMENEVKGRVPLEAIRNPDYDVASQDSEDDSDSDDGRSNGSDDGSGRSKRKKKKEKIIYSTVKTSPSSIDENVPNGSTNKIISKDKKMGKKLQHQGDKNGDKANPAVVVD